MRGPMEPVKDQTSSEVNEIDVNAATRIAVVEKRRLIRQALSIWLSSQGFEVAALSSSIGRLSSLSKTREMDIVVISLARSSQAAGQETISTQPETSRTSTPQTSTPQTSTPRTSTPRTSTPRTSTAETGEDIATKLSIFKRLNPNVQVICICDDIDSYLEVSHEISAFSLVSKGTTDLLRILDNKLLGSLDSTAADIEQLAKSQLFDISSDGNPSIGAQIIGAQPRNDLSEGAFINSNSHESPLEPIVEPTVGPLTAREVEVLALVGQGSTSNDISAELGISRSTVANHKDRIFDKLQANNQAHAVARAVNMGILNLSDDE